MLLRRPGARVHLVVALPVALVGLLATSSPVCGQQGAPDERPAAEPSGRRCDLTWRPTTDATVARIFRQTENAQITYVSGGMIWTCGTATMEADSAVKYDLTHTVELIGDVRYRDTIRTLQSNELTYFEMVDRIVATGDVFLTRLASGSTLEGPRVEFLRAVSGIDEVTLATGRPHMVLRPESDPEAEPFELDADEAEFLGEEEARARGNVDIVRSDLTAAADSAHFRLGDGSGVLFGEPWIEGEAFRLEGDTIRTTFEENELRSVLASGTGHATGESFEVISEDILVGIAEEAVDAVWAYGTGRSLAISGGHRVYGDSLRFVMLEGRIDSVLAVRAASAVQAIAGRGGASGVPPAGESLDAAGQGTGALPTPGNTAVARADTAATTRLDTVSVAADSSAPVLAEPGQRAPAEPGAAPDTLAAESDTLAAASDTLTAESDTVTAVSDALAAPSDTVTASDTLASPAAVSADSRGERVAAPRLAVDATSNWVTGDTLYATFERPAPDSSGIERADSAAVGAETGAPAASDTAEARLERLRVVGNARSFYAAVRDTTRTDRPSRSYLIGRTIDVIFKDGEAQRVIGVDAIGLYLDPADFEAAPAPGGRGATGGPGIGGRRPGPPSDSVPPGAPLRDSLPPDSSPPDTVQAEPARSDHMTESPGGAPRAASTRSRRALASLGELRRARRQIAGKAWRGE